MLTHLPAWANVLIAVGGGVVLALSRIWLNRPSRRPLTARFGYTVVTLHRTCTRCGQPGRHAELVDLDGILAGRELPRHYCAACRAWARKQSLAPGGSPGPVR